MGLHILLSLMLTRALAVSQPADANVARSAAQACAVDLCGKPQEYFKLQASGGFGTLESIQTKQYFQQIVSPLLQKNMQTSQMLSAKSETRQLIEKLKTEVLTAQQKSFVLSLGLFKYILAKQTALGIKAIVPKGEAFEVDRKNLRMVFSFWPAAKTESVANFLNVFLGNSYFAESFTWKNSTFFDYVADKNIEQQQKNRDFIEATISYASAQVGEESFWNFEPELVERMMNQETLSEYQQQSLFKMFLTAKYFIAASSDTAVNASKSVHLAVAEVIQLLQTLIKKFPKRPKRNRFQIFAKSV